MKKGSLFLMLLCLVLILSDCGAKEKPTILVPKAENLAGDFIMGADVSTLLTQEASGVVYYDFDGQPQDLLKVLHDAGVNSSRSWSDAGRPPESEWRRPRPRSARPRWRSCRGASRSPCPA